jgi:hypothetical protein
MRKILFLLLFVPIVSFAQSDESIAAFTISKPDSLGKSVPQLNDIEFSRLYVIRELGLKRKYIYTINTETEYKTIFERYLKDSLPVFDFSKQELVVYAACGQCLVVCNHHGGHSEPCHRNACHFQQAWYVRDKKEQLTVSN